MTGLQQTCLIKEDTMKLGHNLYAILATVVLIATCAGTVAAAPLSVSTSAPTPPATWFGQYYDNIFLQGRPVMLRDDAAIDFDWGDGSPAPQLKGDLFSVRWTRSLSLNATGTWRFTTRTDDGVRLWVDNLLVIDHWRAQPSIKYTADVPLQAGVHLVVLEYFEFTGTAVARLSYELWDTACPGCLPPIEPGAWQGQYYDNKFLGGSPDVTRTDAAIDFDWGNGAPAPGISKDLFSIRWTRTVWLDRGTWRFTLTADDGARLWVDNALLLEEWHDQPPTTYIAETPLGAGYHIIRVEYYEMTGSALARLSYQSLDAACVNCGSFSTGGWRGEYYDNIYLQGGADVVRTDARLDFDWGSGSPDKRISKDMFSARWTQTPRFEAGTYRFHAMADDGVRVYVDSKAVIDEWANNPGTEFAGEIKLSAGNHAIKVEYYEYGYDAKVKVWWEKLP
jgi:hypothetical protein